MFADRQEKILKKENEALNDTDGPEADMMISKPKVTIDVEDSKSKDEDELLIILLLQTLLLTRLPRLILVLSVSPGCRRTPSAGRSLLRVRETSGQSLLLCAVV